MEKCDQKQILVLVTNPFAALNVIHSGLIGELEKVYQVSIISDVLAESDISRLNNYFRLHMRLLPTQVPTVPWLIRKLRTFQLLLFGYFFDLDTVRLKLMQRSFVWQCIFQALLHSYCARHLTGSLLIFMKRLLISLTSAPNGYLPLLQQNYAAVISSSPLDIRENKITNSLKSKGINCISTIISWDNLTSKGILNSKSDLVLVWNKFMAAEYHRFYSIFGDKMAVGITGVPRFDVYFRKRPSPKKLSDFKNQQGIDGRSRVILFSTGATKHHVCQNYIIRDLLEYAEAKSNITILVRCHPGDDRDRYWQFNGIKNLLFFEPFKINGAGVKMPPPDFLETLNMHLQICQVCIQAASTMCLDAIACNKPTISIAYDSYNDTPYSRSVKRLYGYSHQLPLYRLLKRHTADSRHDLFEKLDEIFETGETPADFSKSVKPFIHSCTPNATRMTAQCIRKWLN